MNPTDQPTSLPSAPPQNIPPQSFHFPKVLIAAIVVLIILGAGGIFVLKTMKSKPVQETTIPTSVPTAMQPSPTSDPTANWKTYNDTNFDIAFKYPETWYLQKSPDWTLQIFLNPTAFTIPSQTEFSTPIEISFNEVMNTVTNQKYFQEKTLSEGVNRISNLLEQSSVARKDLIIGGKQAVQISGIGGPGMLQGQYFSWTLIQMDGKLLMISLNKKEYEQLYNQILSTFKFTDQSQVNTSSWKVYTSKHLPFTFQYPQNASISEDQISDFYTMIIIAPGIGISIAPTKDHDSACAGGPELNSKTYQTTIEKQPLSGTETIFPGGNSSTCKSLVYKDYYFVIQFNNQDKQLKTIVDQILSTFKFTPQQIRGRPSNSS